MRILLICLLMPLLGSAQTFDLALSGGIYPTFVRTGPVTAYIKAKARPSYTTSLQATLLRKRSALSLRFTASQMQATIYQEKQPNQPYYEIFGKPTLGLDFIFTNKVDWRKSRILIGWQVGGLINLPSEKIRDPYVITNQYRTFGGGTGPYINYVYYFSYWGIGAEFAPKFIFFDGTHAFITPFLVGAHMQI